MSDLDIKIGVGLLISILFISVVCESQGLVITEYEYEGENWKPLGKDESILHYNCGEFYNCGELKYENSIKGGELK